MGTSSTAHSQIKNIAVTADSSIMIDEVYAGMLAWNETRIDSFSNRPNMTVRFGSALTWRMNPKLSFNAFAVYELGAGKPFLLTQARFDYQPSKKWKISIGNMATPTTELRPFPVSNGQFETWTLARIPGLTPGIKARFTPSATISVATGVALRDNSPEYHFSMTVSPVTAAFYYESEKKSFGTAVMVKTKKLYSIAVYNNSTMGNTTMYSFQDYGVYNDSGYDLDKKQVVRFETGFLRYFKSKWVAGLVGFGFDAKACTLNSYIFVHL